MLTRSRPTLFLPERAPHLFPKDRTVAALFLTFAQRDDAQAVESCIRLHAAGGALKRWRTPANRLQDLMHWHQQFPGGLMHGSAVY